MSKAAVVKFADKILQHFPPFRWDESKEEAWAGDMVQELSGFSDEVVERAGREMVRTRKKPQTPLVSECIDACLGAKRWIEAERQSLALAIGPQPGSSANLEFTNERKTLAWQLACNRNDPLCVAAAKQGWIGVLHQFVRTHQRMPSSTQKMAYRKTKKSADEMVTELEWCKREAKDVDEFYKFVVMHPNPINNMLQDLGEEMLRKRKAKEDFVLHGVCP